MTTIICPYCLKPHPPTAKVCEQNSTLELPPSYLRSYQQKPPLWLATIGFTKHGKTSYLAALSLMLDQLTEVWDETYVEPLGETTVKTIQAWRRELNANVMNKATGQTSQILPNLIALNDMPVGDSRCLVLYDIAGETFDNFATVRDSLAPVLKQAHTVWMFISPHDLTKDEKGRSMTNLLDVYKDSMMTMGIPTEGRELIVVYTKADKLNLPSDLAEYLASDPLRDITIRDNNRRPITPIVIEDYLRQMQVMSDSLRNYTRSLPNGAQFISQVRKNMKMGLQFCMTSATGQDPETNGAFPAGLKHYRVLDPLLWALQSQYADVAKPLTFILNVDTALNADRFAVEVWQQLSQSYDVTTYVLGDSVPVCKPGGSLQTIPNHDLRPRLIGPLLDQIPVNARVLLLNQRGFLDEKDFFQDTWRKRLLIADMSASYTLQCDWDHVVRCHTGDSSELIVNELDNLGG